MAEFPGLKAWANEQTASAATSDGHLVAAETSCRDNKILPTCFAEAFVAHVDFVRVSRGENEKPRR